jgi:hypothetical protein
MTQTSINPSDSTESMARANDVYTVRLVDNLNLIAAPTCSYDQTRYVVVCATESEAADLMATLRAVTPFVPPMMVVPSSMDEVQQYAAMKGLPFLFWSEWPTEVAA